MRIGIAPGFGPEPYSVLVEHEVRLPASEAVATVAAEHWMNFRRDILFSQSAISINSLLAYQKLCSELLYYQFTGRGGNLADFFGGGFWAGEGCFFPVNSIFTPCNFSYSQ
jgi:hypothetical protein